MKWNASSLAPLFLLLAGCMGGGGGYSNAGLEPASGQGSVAAQGWDGGESRRQQGAPRDQQQDGYQQQGGYQATAGGQPGANYERPDMGYERQQSGDVPRPQQQVYPQQQTYPQQRPPQQSTDGYADPAAGAAGPSGRSGSVKHDEVGYAGIRGVAGGDSGAVVGVHRSLPAGSYVEVTGLENGRTILVLITGSSDGAGNLIDLSPAAARQLGSTSSTIPVRVRAVNPTGTDQSALQSGQPAAQRPDTPPVLLNALRKQLPAYNSGAVAATPAPGRSTGARPTPGTARPAPGGKGYYVQIGAFSNAANAQGLARTLGGFVRPGGGLHRVQMGPYRSAGEAEAARADAARRGYGDARVFAQN